MKITKFVHACLLVETPERVTLFDPGVYSISSFDFDNLAKLDDIVITHVHPDHCSPEFIKKLLTKFPDVRITTSPEAVTVLKEQGITAITEASEGIVLFDSPHEKIFPVYPHPEEIGVHYLDQLTHPGDNQSFTETKAVLALPVTGPWGSVVHAVDTAMGLKPKYIVPIHDWHWRDEARISTYETLEKLFKDNGITFFKAETGVPIEV